MTEFPSIDCKSEAAEEALRFLTEKHPNVLRELSQHMAQKGQELYQQDKRAPSAKGRVRSGYLTWARWATRNVPQVTFTDPLEARLLTSSTKAKAAESWVKDNEDFAEIVAAQEAAERAEREAKFRFFLHVSDLAVKHTHHITSVAATKTMSELMVPPEVVEFEGRKALMIYSISIVRNGVEVKHDFIANGDAVTIKHPLMLQGADGKRIIRSMGSTSAKREGDVHAYAKALEYQEDMYLRGYYHIVGKGDETDLDEYYRVLNGSIVECSELDYKLWENKRSSGK